MHYSFLFLLFILINCSATYKILAIFPYNGRSHHIFFSSLVEELAARGHDVTVINYFPVKKMQNLHQISLQIESTENISDNVDMEEHLKNTPIWFKDFYSVYDTARAFKFIANTNCEKLMNNKEIQEIVKEKTKFDVIIVEQFVTDCGLALAHQFKAAVVGMTAHVLMPWTYSRLGVPNNPSFVPNHFFGTGSKPNVITKAKSALINLFLNIYYAYIIQTSDYEIVKSVYPETPDLEELGKNISLIMLNQYFPLTGSRLYGANVIEVGGMHINKHHMNEISDKELSTFLGSAENGVVYISFGSVAKNLPRKTLSEITKFIRNSNKKFVWKVDDTTGLDVAENTILRRWLPQPAILCHPNVTAFITHSGMLSSSEAMHCGVPVIGVPMFGDQFANAASAEEAGLGVTLDLLTLDENVLKEALDTVTQERYQKRAKLLSEMWNNRLLSAMDTAVFWIKHVAKYQGALNMKPATIDIYLYQYLLLDVVLLVALVVTLTFKLYQGTKVLVKNIIVKKDRNKKFK